ncbi:hypothetical protein O2778_06795 [Ancylomarina euxinus]|nr:hypothetical protein [Ancylomarina euxinus]MCZ4694386.1 hypothetical protein [Ancylomarina euxinus]
MMKIHRITRKRKIEKLNNTATRSHKKEALPIVDLQGFLFKIYRLVD